MATFCNHFDSAHILATLKVNNIKKCVFDFSVTNLIETQVPAFFRGGSLGQQVLRFFFFKLE